MTPTTQGGLSFDVRRSVVSESQFPNKTSIDKLISHLRTIKATGKVVICMSEGGVNSVSFEARHALNGSAEVALKFTP